MRISFDIDDTLVCHCPGAAREQGAVPALVCRWLTEPLRPGTRALMTELRRRGCSIWIYTSSGRTPLQIRWWLLLHGIRVDGVVNDDRHRREMSNRRISRRPSKYPPAFGIDLHVDDSEGVRMEGDEYGFKVLVVRPEDGDWTGRVLAALDGCQAKNVAEHPCIS